MRAAIGTAAAATGAAPEDVAEDVTEDVAETGPAEAASRAGGAAHARIDAGMAELVVGGPLSGIAQGLVGLLGLLETLFGLLVARITIGMVFLRQSPEGLLQLRLAGVPADAQHFVIVSLRHDCPCFMRRRKSRRLTTRSNSKSPEQRAPAAPDP